MDDELWHVYVFWFEILILKMMNFIWHTGRLRVARKVIHSDADRMFIKEPGVILDVTGGGNPDIDRIRAAHRSDIETVVPFLLITLLWLETSPSINSVKLIMRSFTLARIYHGFIYMEIIPVHRFVKIFVSVFSYAIIAYVAISLIAHCY